MGAKVFIIIGLGYGDEGKGLVTDLYCRHYSDCLNVRFNGGQQAGHTVRIEKQKHVFSNFGAGTFRGAPTYWSRYCTFSPVYFLHEYFQLNRNTPQFFLDSTSPITTHYDILYNRLLERERGDGWRGTCGLGVGATLDRHLGDKLTLTIHDCKEPKNLLIKLRLIREYYEAKVKAETQFSFEKLDHSTEDFKFKLYVDEIFKLEKNQVLQTTDVTNADLRRFNVYVFEGAQGILLDFDFGAKPYVTKTNTTSKNALTLIESIFQKESPEIEVVYVTRAYQTRHGNGPFNIPTHPVEVLNIQQETNRFNPYQRDFKRRCLDIDQLNYALACDNQFSNGINKTLIVTCLDQLQNDRLPVFFDGKVTYIHYQDISKYLDCKFKNCLFSFNDTSDQPSLELAFQ